MNSTKRLARISHQLSTAAADLRGVCQACNLKHGAALETGGHRRAITGSFASQAPSCGGGSPDPHPTADPIRPLPPCTTNDQILARWERIFSPPRPSFTERTEEIGMRKNRRTRILLDPQGRRVDGTSFCYPRRGAPFGGSKSWCNPPAFFRVPNLCTLCAAAVCFFFGCGYAAPGKSMRRLDFRVMK